MNKILTFIRIFSQVLLLNFLSISNRKSYRSKDSSFLPRYPNQVLLQEKGALPLFLMRLLLPSLLPVIDFLSLNNSLNMFLPCSRAKSLAACNALSSATLGLSPSPMYRYLRRMIVGVDTPETHHPSKPVQRYGKEAEAFTRAQLTGATLYLEFDAQQQDRYGRLLAYVWTSRPESESDRGIECSMPSYCLMDMRNYSLYRLM